MKTGGNKSYRLALWVLGFFVLVAISRDIIANGRPLYCRIQGQNYYPGLRTVFTDPDVAYPDRLIDSIRVNDLWHTFPYEKALFAPIPFSPGKWISRPSCEFARPGAIHPELSRPFRHWLGTDQQGRDVAAGIVSGARVALVTGSVAMAVAFIIGIFLGSIAGYWGDDRLKLTLGMCIAIVPGLILAFFYGFIARRYELTIEQKDGTFLNSILIFVVVTLLFIVAGKALAVLPVLSKKQVIPADMLIMRMADVFNATPLIVLLVSVVALLPRQSLSSLMALIGFFSWTGFAQFIRNELLSIREKEFVLAARASGMSDVRILLRHALPNAIQPALTAFALGIAGAIIIETALSFLGYGEKNMIGTTWGSLMVDARSNLKAWWLILPPGVAICSLILALHTISDNFSKKQGS